MSIETLKRGGGLSLALALWAFSASIAGVHIALLLYWVTAGGDMSSRHLDPVVALLGVNRPSPFEFASYSAMRFLSALAVPGILALGIHGYRKAGLARALLTAAAFALPLFLALSFRLLGLVAAVGFVYSLQQVRAGSGVRNAWLWLGLATVLSLAPVDVSLRVRPLGPRLAPAVDGLLTEHTATLEASGEIVVVGSCGAIYGAPAWVWVW